MIHFKKLKTQAELLSFIQGYNEAFRAIGARAKHPLTLENINTYDEIWGLFESSDLKAGYILNHSPKRSFESLSFIKNQVHLLGKNHCAEVSGLWKQRDFIPYYIHLLPHLSAQFLRLKKKYIFASSYENHPLYNLYMSTGPKIIYRARNNHEVSIFYYKKSQFLRTIIKVFKEKLVTQISLTLAAERRPSFFRLF